jgi:hypothetical protein
LFVIVAKLPKHNRNERGGEGAEGALLKAIIIIEN